MYASFFPLPKRFGVVAKSRRAPDFLGLAGLLVAFADRVFRGSGEQQKLGSLAKALTERPNLRLEITGRAAAEPDENALKQAALDAKVRTQSSTSCALSERRQSGYSSTPRC